MTADSPDPLRVAAQVTALFESLGLRYSIGGSLASSFSGEPRATLDVDILVALNESHVEPLTTALHDDFYVDGGALARAVKERSSANVIHLATSVKVDLFVAGGSMIDDDLLRRRLSMTIGGHPAVQLYVHTPEDILLQKLRWYRLGGDISDRQWRDVLGIVRVQGRRLDCAYLAAGATRLQVDDLLARALGDLTPER